MEKIKVFEEKIKEIEKNIKEKTDLNQWKFKQNIENGEKVEIDDKKWEIKTNPFNWSLKDGTAFFRNLIEIPEEIEGIKITGSKLELTFLFPSGVELFINGKSIYSHKFWADKIATPILLRDKVNAGEKFLIVFKTPFGDGLGSFWANLKIDKIEDILFQLNSLVYQLKFAEFITNKVLTNKEKKTKDIFKKAVDLIDIENIEGRRWDEVNNNINEIENLLEPFRKHSKKFKVHLIGHAHIDMNWLWTYEDTVDVCLRDFQTINNLMDKYNQLTFSQSQVHVYKVVEEHNKELFNKVKERIKEGRWETTANTYVESDLNMVDGESIVRHIIYSKKYNKENFNKNTDVFWSPDTFGHPISIPSILSDAGIRYYYFMRCGKIKPLFRWQGKNNKEVIAFTSVYNNFIKAENIIPGLIEYIEKYNIPDYLFVYGVGDHGGGPTIDDIERKKKLEQKPCMPEFEFSTAERYFKKIEKHKEKLPVVNDELNFIFEGCYTSHSDIKKGNRDCERKLLSLESLIASSGWTIKDDNSIRELWENALFNQFHDILDGSAIHSSYNFSNEIVGKVIKDAEKLEKEILENVKNKQENKITVFNPVGWKRDEYVQLDLPEGYYVEDKYGNVSDISDGVIRCKNLDAYGFNTYTIKKGNVETEKIKVDNFNFENNFYLLKIDEKTGLIRKIYDKVNKKDVIFECKNINEDISSWWAEKSGNLIKLCWEQPHPMSSWIIGNIYKVENLIDAKKVKVEYGKKIVKVIIEREYMNCPILQKIFIYRDFPYIDFEFETNWKIEGNNKIGVPMLRVNFNFNIGNGEFYCEIPFSIAERKKYIPKEYPALKWAGFKEENWVVAILNREKHGYYVDGNNLSLTLLRNPYEPDPSPDTGYHKICYRLFFGQYSITEVMKNAYEFNYDIITTKGIISQEPLFTFDGDVILTSFKKELCGDGYILRFIEVEGKKGKVKIKFNRKIKSFFESNIIEEEKSEIKIDSKNEVIINFSPYSINTYKIVL